jgi:hypothetical protein
MALTQITITRNTGYTQTFNLATMPTSPAPRTVMFTHHDAVASTRSAFTNLTQTQIWPGADWWEVDITLPPMNRTEAAPWIAFLGQLQGQANVFQIGDPGAISPLGTPLGAPLVNGTSDTYNTPGTTTLYTRGWQASAFRLLLPGSYLQIGYRLYMCLDVVDSDSNGDASFTIWPSIREQPADGTAITLHSTTGLFRLQANSRKWSNDVMQLYAISFKATEAL